MTDDSTVKETASDESASDALASDGSAISDPAPTALGNDSGWLSVSPKYIVVDIVGYVIFAAIVLGVGSLLAVATEASWLWIVVAIVAVIFGAVIGFTPRRVRAIGYQLRSDDLLFRRGILVQRLVAVPYGRMQLVDLNRGPLDRLLGLSELKFVTAAASSGVVIPGLPVAIAEELRDALVALAESRRAGL